MYNMYVGDSVCGLYVYIYVCIYTYMYVYVCIIAFLVRMYVNVCNTTPSRIVCI